MCWVEEEAESATKHRRWIRGVLEERDAVKNKLLCFPFKAILGKRMLADRRVELFVEWEIIQPPQNDH